MREDKAPYGGRTVVEGRFLNKGKVAVHYGPGALDTTNFHSTVEEAHAEADRHNAAREGYAVAKQKDGELITKALAGGEMDQDAFARTMGGRTPSTSDVTHFLRTRYGTTIDEAGKHARRITNSRRDAFMDSAGTSRAKVSVVVEYLRAHAGEIRKK